jgi:hypothetical protein
VLPPTEEEEEEEEEPEEEEEEEEEEEVQGEQPKVCVGRMMGRWLSGTAC